MLLWKYIVHAVSTVVVCVEKEILRRQTCARLNLKTLEHTKSTGLLNLFQTHETPFQDWSLYQASAQTVNMNLDYNYRFFTAAERRNFLINHFGAESDQVRAYDSVVNGTIKADIFRICILYTYGGVYLDCKSTTIHPFRTFIPPDTDFAMFVETYNTRLGNSFIYSTPKNALITRLMEEALRRALNKEYGESPLDVTGPDMFGTIVRGFLNISELKQGRYVAPCGVKVDLLGSMNLFDSFMYTRADLPVMKRQPDNYFCSLFRLLRRYELSWIMGRFFTARERTMKGLK